MCVELLISTVFCFAGSSFSYYENEDRVLGLRSSFSRVFVFVTPLIENRHRRQHHIGCFANTFLLSSIVSKPRLQPFELIDSFAVLLQLLKLQVYSMGDKSVEAHRNKIDCRAS